MAKHTIQILRGTLKQRVTSSLILKEGQPFYETDTGTLYVGTGSSIQTVQPIKATPLQHNHSEYATVQDVQNSAAGATTESWTFTLTDGSKIEKRVLVKYD